jgi:hypothetical protein
MQIKRTTAPKAKEQPQQQQQSYDDDPWRPANTTATANIFPYQNTPKNDGTNNENNITNNNNNNSTAEPPQKETALTIQVEPEDENQWFTDIDHISVSIAEKEGFLFTHVNYMVTSSQRQSSVRRRYSDFYWFWEMLLKRYPFRLIPNLPPKKISGSKLTEKKKEKGTGSFIFFFNHRG